MVSARQGRSPTRIAATDRKMPKGKLPAEDIALLTAWVQAGAPWTETAIKNGLRTPGKITDEDRRYRSEDAEGEAACRGYRAFDRVGASRRAMDGDGDQEWSPHAREDHRRGSPLQIGRCRRGSCLPRISRF